MWANTGANRGEHKGHPGPAFQLPSFHESDFARQPIQFNSLDGLEVQYLELQCS